MFLVEVQQFGTGTRYKREILHLFDKRVKNKSPKILRTNSYVYGRYRKKTGRERFFGPTILNRV